MNLRNLRKGENTTLPEEVRRIQLIVTWNDPFGDRDVDASALLLGPGRKVRSDADFIFYNQPTSPDDAICHLGKTNTEAGPEERVAVDLDAISDDVTSVIVSASLDRGTFGTLNPLRLIVIDSAGTPIAQYDITDATVETTIVLGEVYRRSGGWKLRAVGQGWNTGLAGMASEFGVNIDDEEEPEADLVSSTTTTSSVDSVAESSAQETGDRRDNETPTEAHLAESETDAHINTMEHVDENMPGSASAGSLASEQNTSTTAGDISDSGKSPTARSRKVRTRKPKTITTPPKLTLADDDTWQPARMFSTYGVGSNEEQEQRATSALLATIMAVRPFARGITARLGAPAGCVETYTEVSFGLGERKLRPDGVIRTARAGRVWTALVEVKTGSGHLHREQVDDYVNIARRQGFDAVVTISNDICPGDGEHPITIDKRKLRTVALVHMSWAEVLHEARMVLTHRGVADPLQAWLLAELIRYLEHPRSGASGLLDMGAAWVTVRDTVAAGTFRASDRHGAPVAESWLRLVRYMCLRLTAEIGANVGHALPRKLATDPLARTQAVVAKLAAEGILEATLRVPDCVGPVAVSTDLKGCRVRVSVEVPAPGMSGPRRRITWLLRQLSDSVPSDVLVEACLADGCETYCETLGDIRKDPDKLLRKRDAEIVSFRLSRNTPMGVKRSGIRGAFISSVTDAVDNFYGDIVRGLRPWTPPTQKTPVDTESLGTSEPERLLASRNQ